MSRTRLRKMPATPQSLEDLGEIPNEYKQSLSGENFFLYDTYENDEDEEFDPEIRDQRPKKPIVDQVWWWPEKIAPKPYIDWSISWG